MDAQQLLTEFGHIANAPEGVKRLRELVLSFAFSGRLCAPSPDSVVSLIEEIEDQRAAAKVETRNQRLARERAQRTTGGGYFAIPDGWRWISLSTVGHTLGQKKPSKDFYYIDVSSIDNKAGALAPALEVVSASGAPSRARKIVKKGTLIYSTVRPYLLNVAVVDRNFDRELIASTAFAVVHPWRGIEPRYLYHYLRSPHFVRYVESVQIGMAYPAISDEKFYSGLVPIPPTEEQSRIVAKVDELMALCDQLEQQQQERRKLQNALRQSTLQALTNAQSPHELRTSWQRLQANFVCLFSEPGDMEELRLSAMQLAVRGLLTEQRDSEEPATNLLKRIGNELRDLVRSGAAKRAKPLPEVDASNAPYALPAGWCWARFSDLGQFGRGKSRHRPRNDPKLFNPGVYPLVQTGEVARSKGVITEYHSKYSELGLEQSKLWPKGTLCITIAANIADAAILGIDACFPDSVVGFVPALEIREQVDYFLLFMRTARSQLLEFAPSTAQKNINLEILQSVLIPVPPVAEMKRILEHMRQMDLLCDGLMRDRSRAFALGRLLSTATVASLTGITIGNDEDTAVKAPQTELVAPLRLATPPDVKAKAPLATILARHQGEMSARDLWQRFGGEIDAFYAQLKTEVAHGWIAEPEPARVRERDEAAA